MDSFAFLLKSYAGDLPYAVRLVASLRQHNVDNIPTHIVVPDEDIEKFVQVAGRGIFLMPESAFGDVTTSMPVNDIRPGYVNQEVIKLAFWEKALCANYLCLDSDGVFIRDFRLSDFMYDAETPYTILVEDNDLATDPEYYRSYWAGRREAIGKIQDEFGLRRDPMLTCHGFAILSAKVLRALKEKHMEPAGKSYLDLIAYSPYEFSWYNMWLQKDRTIDIRVREPLFKYFHHKNQHVLNVQQGVSLSDMARGYIGVVVNSNYSRGYGLVSYEDGDVYPATPRDVLNAYKWAANRTYALAASIPHRALRTLRRKMKNND